MLQSKQAGEERYLSDIEMAVMPVNTDKVPFKLAAEPVTDFRLQEVKVQFHIVFEFPGVVCTPDIEGELTGDTHFHTCIRSCSPPKKDICLQRCLLAMQAR